MALIACPDCTNQVSSNAAACPKCGHPIKPVQIEVTAKKHKALMTIYLLVAVGGCVIVGYQVINNQPLWIGGFIAVAGAIGWSLTAIASWWRNG